MGLLGLVFVLLLTSSVLVISVATSSSEVCNNKISDYGWSPYYQILLAATNNVYMENKCIKQIRQIFDNLKQGDLWALKALDASGTLPSGFMYAQNFWQGSQKACDIINGGEEIFMSNEFRRNLVTAVAPFPMKYFTLYVNFTTPNQIAPPSLYHRPIHIGVCLPQSCNSETITSISKEVFSENSKFRDIYNLTLELIGVKDTSLMKFFKRPETIVILIGLSGLLIFVAAMNILRPYVKHSLLIRIFDCFNIKENFNNLMDTTTPPGDIATVAGIKSTVCIAILILHLGYYSMFSYNNAGEIAYYANHILVLLVNLTVLFVDTFFVLSAFLVTYSFMRNKNQRQRIAENGTLANVMLYFKLLLNRYVRLTPALLLTIALNTLTALYLDDATQFYITESLDVYCTLASWWRTILYVQNFYPMEEMCGTWTWYLSADMIYFVVALAGLFIYIKTPLLMKLVFFCLSALSILYSFYMNYITNYNVTFDGVYRTRDTIYTAPLVRVNPYLTGILGGYLMYKLKGSTIKISKIKEYGWILVEWASIIFIIFFMKYFRIVPMILIHMANSVGRYYFGCLVIYTVLINNFDYNGIFRKLMGHKFFVHFNKLTYLIYLLFPTIVFIYRAASETAVSFNIPSSYVESVGLILMSYFVSVISSVVLEIPFCRLSAEFLMKKKIRKADQV